MENKNENKLRKEIKKWKTMLKEEKGSLWASENETYIQEKIQLIKTLKSELKGYKKAHKDFWRQLQDLKKKHKDSDWDRGYDACIEALEGVVI